MTDISISIDSAAVEILLNSMLRKADHLQPALDAIGADIAENIKLCFRDLRSPDGMPWQALSPVTIKRRKENSSVPLNDTGKLKNSITHEVDDSSVEIGTNLDYAAMMNFGGKKANFHNLWGDIPARPFMPVSGLPADWEHDVLDAVNHYLGVV